MPAGAVDKALDIADNVGAEQRIDKAERNGKLADHPLHSRPGRFEVIVIRTVAAIDGVAARAAVEAVIAAVTEDRAVAGISLEDVGRAVALDCVVRPTADHILDDGARSDDEAGSRERAGLSCVQIDERTGGQGSEIDCVNPAICVSQDLARRGGGAHRAEFVRVIVIVVNIAGPIGPHRDARYRSRITRSPVSDPNRPVARRQLAKMGAGGEDPVAKVRRAPGPVMQIADRTGRRDQLDHEISRIGVGARPGDLDLDRLDGQRRSGDGQETDGSRNTGGIVVGYGSGGGIRS